ncbi:malate dehydrogenase (oxaloacetate-decarboxylating) [Saccharopolyspora lacisalsi]|uniref:Malate dehydrogenase (Oxaloacetate-decarboxylating) n=1 Tax=Halosaccharopolyspora lacisalsi TaxID=1000566 RepID=A0A839DXM4_9PSEU|nr:NAD-dependent malic enzyme [Halosaccharopolyspora lacisalsi]MBA8826712.1 malate dehydrogenase (oxaloacetate-decarboxylating) [Halosaccharopolyspora lacisalsi]
MPVPGPGYSITVRLEAPPSASAAGDLTSAIGRAGGVITAFDVVESHADRIVVDITCNSLSTDHADDITSVLRTLSGVSVRKISDRTFLVHLGGKIEVNSKVALANRDDLSRAYTPGVARVCTAIAENPDDARRLTVKRNTVAVLTDGSAVLGLGNIGPEAALPVMEGKAALFKKFSGVNAWPVCLDTQDTEELIRAAELIAPVYGGINLEDIAAPRCFEIEARLRSKLDIPVFHDDQHGTAIVVLGALRNALRVVNKDISDCRIVVCGVGAAGSAIIRLLRHKQPRDVIAVDIDGIVHQDRGDTDDNLRSIAGSTNGEGRTGTLSDAVDGADVFIGVSAPNTLGTEDVAAMSTDAIVFALANPDPEIDPLEAQKHATVVATGRSDHPNQINNVLAFPGFFRGLLDAHAHDITDDMMIAASNAIADVVDGNDRVNASFIVPSVFDSTVAPAVADAVRRAAASEQSPEGSPALSGSAASAGLGEDLEF